MNATQYRNKVKVRINTDLQLVEISAFDIKVDDTKNGKLFVKKGQGTSLYINIEQVEQVDFNKVNPWPEKISQVLDT